MNLPDEPHPPGPFELSGGCLCLDFANTWGNQDDAGSDRLRAFDDLVRFARQAEMLDEASIARIERSAADDPAGAQAVLTFAQDLRASLYRIFAARAAGRPITGSDLDRINQVLGVALSHRRLEQREGALQWSWTDLGGADPHALLWPVVESAASLLTSDEVLRIRECDAGDCYWLFLDGSRSGSRRWCSMKSCGNRAKARRHYRRQRKERRKSEDSDSATRAGARDDVG